MRKFHFLISILAVALLSMTGCGGDDKTVDPPPTNTPVNRGNYDASRHVGIGVSLTAGFQNNSLYSFGQRHSYDYLIARAAHGADTARIKFQIPEISNPGISAIAPGQSFGTFVSGRVELQSLASSATTINASVTTTSNLLNNTLARPFNNLGMPGSLGFLSMNVGNSPDFSPARFNGSPFYQIVLRDTARGANVVQQANRVLAAAGAGQQLVTVWLGPNEILGYATTGGAVNPIFSLDNFTPLSPTTSAPPFRAVFDSLLAQLGRANPSETIVLMNIPNVSTIPFATTIGPIVDTNRVAGPGMFFRRGRFTDTTTAFAPFNAGVVGNPSRLLVLLPAGAFTPLVGRPTPEPWRSVYTSVLPLLPAGTSFAQFVASQNVDTTAAFGTSRRNPFPGTLVLDSAEIANINAATTQYNTYIGGKANGSNIFLVDIAADFTTAVSSGLRSQGDNELLLPALFTGNLFSLDGVHPSAKGHAYVANKIITILNQRFGSQIPFVNTAPLDRGLYVQGSGQRPLGGGSTSSSVSEYLKLCSPESLAPTIQAMQAIPLRAQSR
jgi:hypothetical protein